MMIHAIVRNGDFSTNLVFPTRDNAMQDRLDIIGISMKDTTSVYVSEILTPAELQELSNKYLNLDELNYLAKRMDSFSTMEMEQFYATMAQQGLEDLKSLINLTFNLDKFTLIQDISSLEAVGRAYLMNEDGALPANDRNHPRYAELGRRLLESGRGIATERGLLFVSPKPMDEVYDGRIFPEYHYRDSLIRMTLQYGGQEETLYLPYDDLAITKCVYRLGADSEEDCEILLEDFYMGDGWEERLNGLLHDEGIWAVNDLLRVIQEAKADPVKLEAMAEYLDVGSSAALKCLCEHMVDFCFMEGVENPEEVGRWFVDNDENYEMPPGLEEFFDFDAFGERLVEEREGKFLGSDFVCCDEYFDLEEITRELEELENGQQPEMTM